LWPLLPLRAPAPKAHRSLTSPRPPPPQLHEARAQEESIGDGASTLRLVMSSRGHAQRTMMRARLAIGAFPALYRRWGFAGRVARVEGMGTAPGT